MADTYKLDCERRLKDIMGRLKMHYFQFLSSLRVQNPQDSRKMRITRLASSRIGETEEEFEAVKEREIDAIRTKDFNFEGEVASELSGLANAMQLMTTLQELQALNTQLRLYVVTNAPATQLDKESHFASQLAMLEKVLTAELHKW